MTNCLSSFNGIISITHRATVNRSACSFSITESLRFLFLTETQRTQRIYKYLICEQTSQYPRDCERSVVGAIINRPLACRGGFHIRPVLDCFVAMLLAMTDVYICVIASEAKQSIVGADSISALKGITLRGRPFFHAFGVIVYNSSIDSVAGISWAVLTLVSSVTRSKHEATKMPFHRMGSPGWSSPPSKPSQSGL